MKIPFKWKWRWFWMGFASWAYPIFTPEQRKRDIKACVDEMMDEMLKEYDKKHGS